MCDNGPFKNLGSSALKEEKNITIFFLTEMWERYGFYVVQSLLALYLVSHYGLLDEQTYRLVGAFTALTYVSPVVGGLIADKWLGQTITIRIGAIILASCYLMLALNLGFFALTFALSGIAVGTGLLKPNISSLLGNQYQDNCPSRQRGFILFYMGITTGIILGTTAPSLIYKYFGWHVCFLTAGFGLIIAYLVFHFGVKHYGIKDYIQLNDKVYGLFKTSMTICLLWNVCFIILSRPNIALWFFILVFLFAIAYVLSIFIKEKNEFRKEIISLLLLCLISVFFWTFYFQMFLSLTLFITRAVKPAVFHIQFPAPYYVAVESLAMIVFGAFFAHFSYRKKSCISVAESTSRKFTLSMALLLVAYFLIYYSMKTSSGNALVSPVLILIAYIVIAASELLLSPVGLSAVTEMSKPKYVSTLTGVFFISLGLGGYLSGMLASLTSINTQQVATIYMLKAHYQEAFSSMLLLLLVAVMISLKITLIIRFIHKKKRVTP